MEEESMTSKINKMSKADSTKLAINVAVFLGVTTWKEVFDKALENSDKCFEEMLHESKMNRIQQKYHPDCPYNK